MSLDLIYALKMAKSNINFGNDSEIKPYQFDTTGFSDSEDKNSESETDIREQASFTEHLGTIDWRKCTKCTLMPSGIESVLSRGGWT